MPRATWSGTISFGLITMPINLYTAVRSQSVGFKQLCGEHKVPIRQRNVCSGGGEEVAHASLVKGFPLGGDEFVILQEEDFQRAAVPIGKAVELEAFLPTSEVDLRLFDTPYIVGPGGKDPGRSYVLLREALRETGMVGIGRICLRTSMAPCALRVLDDMLVLHTLHWPDELVALGEFSAPDVRVTTDEVALAISLIEARRVPAIGNCALEDAYRKNLQQIIEARATGAPEVEFTAPTSAPQDDVLDLVAMLQASIAQAQGARVATAPAETLPAAPAAAVARSA